MLFFDGMDSLSYLFRNESKSDLEPLGQTINLSIVSDEKGHSGGMYYSNSDGIEFDFEVNEENVQDFSSELVDNFIRHYTKALVQLEEEELEEEEEQEDEHNDDIASLMIRIRDLEDQQKELMQLLKQVNL